MQPVDTAHQLRALRFVLASVLYGQDSLIRMQSPVPAPLSDSIPLVLDPIAPHRMPTTRDWQDAQFQVLSDMVTAIPTMPHSAWPAACRAVSTAIRHLSEVMPEGSFAQRSNAKQLHDLLGDAFTRPGVCH
jgi:hypothetical protein